MEKHKIKKNSEKCVKKIKKKGQRPLTNRKGVNQGHAGEEIGNK